MRKGVGANGFFSYCLSLCLVERNVVEEANTDAPFLKENNHHHACDHNKSGCLKSGMSQMCFWGGMQVREWADFKGGK